MKSRISPYIRAEQLIREHAAIDIANLIVNNERLLKALKNMILYLDHNGKESDVSELARETIQKAEGK